MANLSTHYKEREPEQTVEIIKNFFNKNGLDIKLVNLQQSEAGTWFCQLHLFNKEIFIGKSNGKGVSKEYALASGYAELYERFCNSFFTSNPYWSKSLIDYNQSQNGYNFRKDEKILSIEEQLKEVPAVDKFCKAVIKTEHLRDKIINYITDNKIIGLPYKSIDGTNTIYLDPRLSIRLTHSVGMSAGNTETEALVQGISEIIESYAYNEIICNPERRLYAINLESITDPTLSNLIENIKKYGYDLYLFDLSYSLGVPAMMSFIIDRKYGITNMNFSSFPVFEIAAERVLTELYQGIMSYHDQFFLISTRVPYKLFDEPAYILKANGNSIDGTVMPYTLLENIVWKDEYNNEYFIDKNSSNEEYLKYLVSLTKKINLNLYFLNNSLTEEMSAITIVNIDDFSHLKLQGFNLNIDEIGEGAICKLINYYETIFNSIYNNEYDATVFFELLTSQYILDNYTKDSQQLIFLWNFFDITENNSSKFDMLNQILFYNGKINGSS